MPYVQRDDSGAVTGAYVWPQPGYAEEFLPDDDPSIVAFRARFIPLPLTRWQFFTVAALNGIITQQAAQSALAGVLPQPFVDFIGTLPTDQQFPATMLLSGTQEFHRDHPFVAAFLAAKGMTNAQADAIWAQGAALIS